MNENRLVVIGGVDPTGNAGILQDIKVAHYFGIECVAIISANTVQSDQEFISLNPVEDKLFQSQFNCIMDSKLPSVIKSGVLASVNQVEILAQYLRQHPKIKYICDPVMISTSGGVCMEDDIINAIKAKLLPLCYLLTPNLTEAAYLLAHDDSSSSATKKMAHMLGQKFKPQHVLLKGGHSQASRKKGIDCLWQDSREGVFFKAKEIFPYETRGTGCALATSIAALIVKGEKLSEAVCISKYYLSLQMSKRKPTGKRKYYLPYTGYDEVDNAEFLANIYHGSEISLSDQLKFPVIGHKVGFYPVVDNVDWLKKLAVLGVKTIQLRLKNLDDPNLDRQIKAAAIIAKTYSLSLFINDHWQLAIKYGCFGVHLGQEDLEMADLKHIMQSGLHLGISTHNYIELARALTINPSYIALGPIYPTITKQMEFNAQGLEKLKQWRKLCRNTQLVAIGGIFRQQMPRVWQTGVDGLAVVSYITMAKNLQYAVDNALSLEKIALGKCVEGVI